jgi:hypothetical protein
MVGGPERQNVTGRESGIRENERGGIMRPIVLVDGMLVEMRSPSELAVDSAADGLARSIDSRRHHVEAGNSCLLTSLRRQ